MFNRKRKSHQLIPAPGLFHRMNSRIQDKLHKLAGWMQMKTRHWKAKQQRYFLFILCLVLGGASTYRLLVLFDGMGVAGATIIKPQPLPLPVIPRNSSVPYTAADTAVFRHFRSYLDSLLKTPEGRKIYNEFLKNRPGFMDSLVFVEKTLKRSFPNY